MLLKQVVSERKVALDRARLLGALAVAAGEVGPPAKAEREIEVRLDEVKHVVRLNVALAQRKEDLLLVEVARVLVVVAVRQLPRVERHENGRVQQRAKHIVQQVVARERTVAAVVAEHKVGPHHGSLHTDVPQPDNWERPVHG